MKQLISNTAFGHYLRKLNYGNYIALRMNYDDFLSQVLELWMFVPCELIDGIWTVLNDTYSVKPDRSDYFNDEGGNPELYQYNVHNWLKYNNAKDRVLFEGWKLMQHEDGSIVIFDKDSNIIEFSKTGIWIFDEYISESIDNLCFYSEKENIQFQLTPTAQKQIGL